MNKKIWIQINDHTAAEETISYLHDLSSKTPGNVELIVYSRKEKAVNRLGEEYAVEESVYPLLVDKFGAENVRMKSEESERKYIPPVMDSPELRRADTLDEIACILYDIAASLRKLSDPVQEERGGSRFYCAGAFCTYE